jgi:[ribosomal protein S5]-alanine N-acetyltransferase
MIKMLSEHYYVRALSETDVGGPYPSWFEDQEVCAFNSHGKFVRTKEYFRQFVRNLDGQSMIVWAICHMQDGHIGNVALQNISLINRNAEFAIILGDRSHWGKGVGELASKAILEHGFNKLNLHRIYCGTAATNEGMKKLALKLGMKEEGIRKEHLFLSGKWVDVVEYGILQELLDPAV